jgi:hypothetical protein
VAGFPDSLLAPNPWRLLIVWVVSESGNDCPLFVLKLVLLNDALLEAYLDAKMKDHLPLVEGVRFLFGGGLLWLAWEAGTFILLGIIFPHPEPCCIIPSVSMLTRVAWC